MYPASIYSFVMSSVLFCLWRCFHFRFNAQEFSTTPTSSPTRPQTQLTHPQKRLIDVEWYYNWLACHRWCLRVLSLVGRLKGGWLIEWFGLQDSSSLMNNQTQMSITIRLSVSYSHLGLPEPVHRAWIEALSLVNSKSGLASGMKSHQQ